MSQKYQENDKKDLEKLNLHIFSLFIGQTSERVCRVLGDCSKKRKKHRFTPDLSSQCPGKSRYFSDEEIDHEVNEKKSNGNRNMRSERLVS